jgi:uncharacterized protein YbjT (DUF2867 family)
MDMTNMSGIVLVTGAFGKTGRRCIAHLVKRGVRVRALVRRDEAARELRDAGVEEACIGDMFDTKVIETALAGVAQVLHICPPMHPSEHELACAVVDESKRAGVRRFVMWSVLHPHAAVPHHQRKQRAEADLIESGLSFTILQPGRYMQHLETIWGAVRTQGLHSFPFSTRSRFSLAHLDDLAAAATRVLTEDGHENAIYELAGPEALTQQDCARILSEALGRTVNAHAASIDEAVAKGRAAGLPEWRIETLAIMNRHYDAHGLEGNPNVLRWLLGREPKTFREYVKEMSSV